MKLLDWLLHSQVTVKTGVPLGPPLSFTGAPIYFLMLLACWIGSWVWIASDAQKRGKSPFWAVFFLFFAGWPLSIAWWCWLRPPYLDPLPVEGRKLSAWEWSILAIIIVVFVATLFIASDLVSQSGR